MKDGWICAVVRTVASLASCESFFQLSRLVPKWKKKQNKTQKTTGVQLVTAINCYYCLSLPIPHTTFLLSFFFHSFQFSSSSSRHFCWPFSSFPTFSHFDFFFLIVVLFALLPFSDDLASLPSPFPFRTICIWAAAQHLPGLTHSQNNFTTRRFPFRADLQPTASEPDQCPPTG